MRRAGRPEDMAQQHRDDGRRRWRRGRVRGRVGRGGGRRAMRLVFLEAPWDSMKALSACSCMPRRKRPWTVGMRGSAHPSTCSARPPPPPLVLQCIDRQASVSDRS